MRIKYLKYARHITFGQSEEFPNIVVSHSRIHPAAGPFMIYHICIMCPDAHAIGPTAKAPAYNKDFNTPETYYRSQLVWFTDQHKTCLKRYKRGESPMKKGILWESRQIYLLN